MFLIKEPIIKQKYNALSEKHKELRKQKQQLEAKISLLQTKCDHGHIKDDCGIGNCPDCGFETDGWLCKISPTKECDYGDPETDEYDEDCCIYCGHPEERK